MPMIVGSTPTLAQPRTMPSGFLPAAACAVGVVTTSAAAPSTMPVALPAVTNDSGPNAGGSFASPSSVVLGKQVIVLVDHHASSCPASPRPARSPRRSGRSVLAALPSVCERSANSSCCLARDAVLARQVVGGLRHVAAAVGVLAARPSASPRAAPWPSLQPAARAADHVRRLAHVLHAAGEHPGRLAELDHAAPPVTTAWRPEPHRRLTVSAGTSCGSPALSATWRAP